MELDGIPLGYEVADTLFDFLSGKTVVGVDLEGYQ